MTNKAKEKAEVLAIHEAAHTVASRRLYRPDHPLHVFKPVESATIEPDEHGAVGVTALRRIPSRVKTLLTENLKEGDVIRGLVEDVVVYSIAGYAAEERLGKQTKEDAWSVIKEYGHLTFTEKRPALERDWSPDITQAWEYLEIFEPHPPSRQYWLKLLFERTWKFLGDWWPDIERVAKALLERGSLNSDDLNELLGRSDA